MNELLLDVLKEHFRYTENFLEVDIDNIYSVNACEYLIKQGILSKGERGSSVILYKLNKK